MPVLILTIIVCFTIILATILSETDLTDILLTPIEVMIEVADKVAKDPIKAKNIEELEQGVIYMLQKNKNTNKNENKYFKQNNKHYDETYNSYEVKAVMNAIIKISALLAMSVGEAGGEIIHKNLHLSDELQIGDLLSPILIFQLLWVVIQICLLLKIVQNF